jgi:lipopolysaccharide/colanic/teichoic acid biosynthesis glycosyltransferase
VKRLLDLGIGLAVSALTAPLVLAGAVAVLLEDGAPAFYVASRVGQGGRPFRMVKLRSMVRNADRTGVDSTAADDPRLLRAGRWLRKLKVDELPQFWHVVRGDMAIVGPRPNVQREVALYTEEERGLLAVRPGITDLSSITFSDYEQILHGRPDPDLAYNQLIRPWKSRLGLLYARAPFSFRRDMQLVGLTVLTVVSRARALRGVAAVAESLGADARLVAIAGRRVPLEPAPPPGATEIVQSRERPPAVTA